MNGKKDRTRIDRFRVFWTVLAAVVLLVVPSMRINAADGYIAKWKEYQAASGKPDDYAWTWNEVVDAMDAVLNQGKELYAAGDTQAAYKAVSDAYYGYSALGCQPEYHTLRHLISWRRSEDVWRTGLCMRLSARFRSIPSAR